MDTNLSISYLSQLENNTRKNPRFDVILKIAKALEEEFKNIFFAVSEIESLKNELNILVEKYGVNDVKVLRLSQILDLLLVEKMKEN